MWCVDEDHLCSWRDSISKLLWVNGEVSGTARIILLLCNGQDDTCTDTQHIHTEGETERGGMEEVGEDHSAVWHTAVCFEARKAASLYKKSTHSPSSVRYTNCWSIIAHWL